MRTFKIRHKIFFACIVIMLLSACGTVWAEEGFSQLPPVQYPALFYGTVCTEAGQPVPAGVIRAYVDNKLCGQLPFYGGQYGLPSDDPGVKRLLVYSEEDISGKEITFKIYAVGVEYQVITTPEKVLVQPQTKQEVNFVVPLYSAQKNILDVFSDIKDHWSGQTVREMAYKGLVGGYEDGTFRPENLISRVEGAAMLERAFNLSSANMENKTEFSDAADIPSWAEETVAKVVAGGLMSGYQESDGSIAFHPMKTLTRYEFAVILSRLAPPGAAKGTFETVEFKDFAEIPEWARQAVNVAVQEGMIKGYPDGTFKPQKEVTRAEAVAMIARVNEAGRQ
jgi:hypothetical protein